VLRVTFFHDGEQEILSYRTEAGSSSRQDCSRTAVERSALVAVITVEGGTGTYRVQLVAVFRD